MIGARTFAAALAIVLSMPALAQTQSGPFVPREPSFDEAWKRACWDKAQFQIVAHDCLTQGRNVDYRWTADWLKEVDAATPAKIAEMRAASANAAARQNMAYRVLIARNMSHDDAVVICGDMNAVNAIITTALLGLSLPRA
jgi:hypothetical protein